MGCFKISKKIKNIFSFLICLTLIFGLSVSVFASDNTITVAGKGIVSVSPDTATISFSIITIGKTSTDAQRENTKTFDNLKKALTDSGILSENIKTSWYRVYPEYRYDDYGDETLIGYRAYNNINVATSDVDNVGRYIDIALNAGVTENNGVSFTLSQPEKYYGDALKLSIKNAQKSAEVIAATLGKTITSPISVTELGNGNAYDIVTTDAVETEYETAAASVTSSSSSGDGYVDYGYNDINISARVTVVYSFD